MTLQHQQVASAPEAAKSLSTIASKDRNSFGAVRLAAAILVVWTHAFTVINGETAWEPLKDITGWSLGAHAVHAFFSLSGFLVAASWERSRSIVDFMFARALRIMPALICVNLLIVVIAGLCLTTAPAEDFWTAENVGVYLFKATLLFSVGTTLLGVFTENPWPSVTNIPIWTVRYEVTCYLSLVAFMWLNRLVKLTANTRRAAIAVILVLSSLVLIQPGQPDYVANLARLVFAFYLGVGAWFERHWIRLTVPAAMLILAGTFVAVILSSALARPALILITAYFSFWLGSVNFGWLTRATNRTDLSYGIYISAFFIQQLLISAFPSSGVLANALGAIVISGLFAWLSWTLVEQPALHLRHRRFALRKKSAECP